MSDLVQFFRSITAGRYFPVLVLIFVNISFGIFIADHYGESWDEENAFIRAKYSLDSYSAINNGGESIDFGEENSKYYGPAFLMAGQMIVQLFASFSHGWSEITVWHFTYFLAFQLGIFSFYYLCLRVMKKKAALGATLLFSTQPLLWGHAFINPKDIPFMSFFLASVASGIFMTESIMKGEVIVHENDGDDSEQEEDLPKNFLKEMWLSADLASKRRMLIVFGTLLFMLLIIWPLGTQQFIPKVINELYAADKDSFLGGAFFQVAEYSAAIPVEAYVQKGVTLFNRAIIIATSVLLGFSIRIAATRVFPSAAQRLWQHLVSPQFRKIGKVFRGNSALIAGTFLGLCTAIRIAGPFSGILVGGYLLAKRGKKAVPQLIKYFITASLVTYLTWPFLWPNPIGNLIDSVRLMSRYPWEGQVLFDGIHYFANELPTRYVPTLMLIKFTEPVVFLTLGGVALVVITRLRRLQTNPLVYLFSAWMLFPLTLLIIYKSNLYDNFRVLLFLVPPIFFFSGISIDQLIARLRSGSLSIILIAALTIPGVYSIIRLHPYEYVYYNSFVGGLAGASRRFELDYWQTSYKEGSEFINEYALPNSKVGVWGALHIPKKYLRDDLMVKKLSGEDSDACEFDYVMLSTRNFSDKQLPNEPVVYSVIREGSVFLVVKELKSCDSSNS